MSRITEKLQQGHPAWLVVYASSAAFMTYFCMYAFRKPYTAASWEQVAGWGGVIDFKIALVLSQIFGYTLAKFIGIKVISEMATGRRSMAILGLVLIGELALIAFALTPTPINIGWLFINGLSLGMIWGLVFSFLEGRRTTEVLGAVLSITFIVASGMVRTVGRWLLLEVNVPELWMPALTGAIFTIPLFISVWLLSRIPPPTSEDEAERLKRQPMNAAERWRFFKDSAPGITMLVVSYLLFTALRDFQDNFSPELWTALGYGSEPTIFASVSFRIAFVVLVVLGAMVFIRNNRTAFMANHLFILLGIALMAGATWGYQQQLLDGKSWMVLIGAGTYVAFIPFNCFLFDRMIASVGMVANAGFLIYVADSAGYVGAISIMLYRTFAAPELSWLSFFIKSVYATCAMSGCLVLGSAIYFSFKLRMRWVRRWLPVPPKPQPALSE